MDKEHSEKFFTLPKRLRDKIVPPKKLTAEQQLEKLRLEASIFPIEYKSARVLERSRDRRAGEAPPLLTGGESIPVTSGRRLPSFDALETLKIVAAGHRGKFQFVSIPKPDKSKNVRHSFVDWLTFTFKLAHFPLTLHTNEPAVSEFDYVSMLSASLYDV
ncbi:MAG: hypothetical protein ACXV8O_08405, partial [Methylobacter sp.]